VREAYQLTGIAAANAIMDNQVAAWEAEADAAGNVRLAQAAAAWKVQSSRLVATIERAVANADDAVANADDAVANADDAVANADDAVADADDAVADADAATIRWLSSLPLAARANAVAMAFAAANAAVNAITMAAGPPYHDEDTSDELYCLMPLVPLKFPQDLPLCDDCDDCSICLDSNPLLPRVKTPCGHIFHKACLIPLTKNKRDSMYYVPCPLCRSPFVLDEATAAEEFAKLSLCTCCTRHTTNRPPSYAYWETPNSFTGFKEPLYFIECYCSCRHNMRELVLMLPSTN
jgi:hypothetical protein